MWFGLLNYDYSILLNSPGPANQNLFLDHYLVSLSPDAGNYRIYVVGGPQ